MTLRTAAQLVGAALNMGAFAFLHFEIAPSSALRYLVPNPPTQVQPPVQQDAKWSCP